jgi:CheY-like chemotaxis protein
MRRNALTILLAEDDDGHAVLVERHLRRSGVTATITRTHDGQDALDFVHGHGAHAGRHIGGPPLVLLDIPMPRLDGIEVLRRLKASSATASIPVVMLTTTDNPQEIARCYALGCNVYVTKPVSYEALSEALHRLALFLGIIRVADGPTAAYGGSHA